MAVLNIYDVSSIVHFGNYAKTNLAFYNMNIKGIRTLAREIALALSTGSDVALAFDSRSFRKDILDCYKKGRRENREVDAQIEIAYDIFMKAGIPCYKVDGMEADDIINWIVKDMSSKYNEIIIRTNDRDLAHNVKPGVVIKELSKTDGFIINKNNFSIILSNDNYHVPYNTVTAFKLFNGCSSDKIPRFKGSVHSGRLFRDFLEFLKENDLMQKYNVMTSPKAVAVFINKRNDLTEDDKKELFKRIRLVYPAEKPKDLEFKPVGKSGIRNREFAEILTMCKENNGLKCMKYKRQEISEGLIEHMKRYGDDVKSGAFSVDRNLEVDPTVISDTEIMFIKEF